MSDPELPDYYLDPFGELAQIIDSDVDESKIVINIHGLRYRLERIVPDVGIELDAEAFRAHINKYAGIWKDVDTDAMKEELYRAREEGSRPIDRP